MELKTRILTSIAFLAYFIILYIVDDIFLMWLSLGVGYILALKEAKNLFQIKIDDTHIYIFGILFWISILFHTNINMVFLAIVLYTSIKLYQKNDYFDELKLALYPTVSFVFIFMLYRDFGIYTFFWLILVVAICDSGAYFVGKKFGKTKFSDISPNKTLEGVLGGVGIATIIGAIISPSNISFFPSLIICVLVSVSSVYGDLFQSYLKRKVGLKDSGNILPGHGGILDRADGHIFGAIVMYVLISIV